MARSANRTANISVKVEPEVKIALEIAADADGRTVSAYVERLIVRDLLAQGRLPPNKDT